MLRYSGLKISVLYWMLAICFVAAGCILNKHSFVRNSHRANQLSLKIILYEDDRESLPENVNITERQWISFNRWYPKPSSDYITLSLTEDCSRGSISQESFRIDEYAFNNFWPGSNKSGEPVKLVFTGDMGKVSFEGELGCSYYERDVTAFGMVLIEVNRDEINKIKTAFEQGPSLDILIPLILKDITAEQLIKFADCGIQFNLDQAGDLVAYNFEAATVKKLIDNGYKFDAEDIVRLARYHVSSDYSIGWKKAGYDLSAKELIYAKQRNLNSEAALEWRKIKHDISLEKLYWIKQRNLKQREYMAWKDAGHELSLENLYWVKQRNLHPQDFIAWQNAGHKFSLDKLYWIKQRNLSPQEASEWKKSGYNLTLDKLYWAKQRNLSPQEASEWKKLGYDFSIEDLYELKRYNIKPSYGAAFADPDYEQLSVKQLIEFKRSNISAETIKNLRKRRSR